MTYRDPFVAIAALELKAEVRDRLDAIRLKNDAALNKIGLETAKRMREAYESIYGTK
jgi:hypothetical protein